MTASVRTASAPALRQTLLPLFVLLAIAGCALTENVRQVDTLEGPDGQLPIVLLMPPDILYYEVTAGGANEPHAEWTEAARSNFRAAAQAYAADLGANLVLVDDDMTPAQVRYRKLHEAVGHSVMLHYLGEATLPAKDGAFDWSLGPGIGEIAEEHHADYALFAYYRDKQATHGRLALSVLGAAATAAATGIVLMPRATIERGFATLVDLRTGDIAWLNQVHEGVGELRDPEGARQAVATLFKNMPPIRNGEGAAATKR